MILCPKMLHLLSKLIPLKPQSFTFSPKISPKLLLQTRLALVAAGVLAGLDEAAEEAALLRPEDVVQHVVAHHQGLCGTNVEHMY